MTSQMNHFKSFLEKLEGHILQFLEIFVHHGNIQGIIFWFLQQ